MREVVTAEELADRLGEVTVLDVRWELARDDGEPQYLAGHVPGACYVDLEHDLAGPPADPVDERGRHPLPEPARFAAAMRRCGVRLTRPVVVLDAAGGLAAARCWWLLRHHGHADVRLLDGGWTCWRDRGLPAELGRPEVAPGDFVATAGHLEVLDHGRAARVAREGLLLDARAPERFRGQLEPVDPVAGHVPGALNLPATVNLVEGSHRLRGEKELRRLHHDALTAAEQGRPVAVYCGSGVTAALDVLVLRALGVESGLYAGSWSGWSSDPARPVATGD
jgi:thiosulfate/3-mercaptopyruvate sulfurtransferase